MRRLIPLILLAASALILAIGCSKEKVESITEPVLSVKAMTLKPADRHAVSTYTGNLEGNRQAVLYSKLAESVDSVLVAEGAKVKAGQVIVSLDRFGPSSNYHEAEATYRNAEKNHKKMKRLFEEGAISELEYDGALTEYEVARATFDAARRLVHIQSPIAGTVTSVDVAPGDFVNVGTRLATVASEGKLRVRFGVNPGDIEYFEIGGRVTVTSDAINDTATGKVVSIASSADPTTRTFGAEAVLDNTTGRFKPGMFVRLNYVRTSFENAIVVPRSAVLILDNQPAAFVVSHGKAERRPLELGMELPGEVIVASGLSAGDTLVTLGQDYLDDDMKVKITELNGMAL